MGVLNYQYGEDKLYRSVYLNSIDAIIISSPEGEILTANPAASRLFGMSIDELTSSGCSALIDESDTRKHNVFPLVSDGVSRSGELRMKRKDGCIFPCWITSSPFTGDRNHSLKTIIIRDVTAQVTTEERLKQSANELREMAKHMEVVKENERTAISMNLHDDLGQNLTALKMDLHWLKSRFGEQPEHIEKKLQSMSKLIDESVTTVRRISSELRPTILYDFGLADALKWHLGEFTKTTSIEHELDFDQGIAELNDSLSIVIFRIAQEALTNVARHSGASEVTVKVSSSPGSVTVMISDNGKGIGVEEIRNHKSLGLLGIKERARAFGGEVSISGSPGAGTVVLAKLPLDF
ncbi:MAG: PAS domain-containing sensor histidine kinase [Bacteroidales bacterium]